MINGQMKVGSIDRGGLPRFSQAVPPLRHLVTNTAIESAHWFVLSILQRFSNYGNFFYRSVESLSRSNYYYTNNFYFGSHIQRHVKLTVNLREAVQAVACIMPQAVYRRICVVVLVTAHGVQCTPALLINRLAC